MTIYAPPATTIEAALTGASTGLVGTLGIRILDTPSGVTFLARTTAGIVENPAGSGIYEWSGTGPSTAGTYSVVWDTGGATPVFTQEDLVVTFSPIPGGSSNPLYLTLAQLKGTLEMTGTTFADADVTLAIGAASRAVDEITGRRFWLDADATKIRYYTPLSYRVLQIDDLVVMTSVAIDRGGTGTYSESWVNGTDYVLEPFNGPSEQPARPYETLRVRFLSGRWLPTYIEKSVQVTGQFGWASVPGDVTAACGILAAKLLRRSREAPFGIITAGIDQAVAMRISRTDPDVYMLLKDYTRHEPFV
jgi:hypothetical protein